MYIITQTRPLEKNKGIIFTFEAQELEKEYLGRGYQRRERSYKVRGHHREYIVTCPEFRNEGETIVIIPDFLVPGRPYPVYVYLYAIDRYSSNPGMGQREAARQTRVQFGLGSFAHTTLGRALKAFAAKNEAATDTSGFEAARPNGKGPAAPFEAASQEGGRAAAAAFPSARQTAPRRRQAAQILGGQAPPGQQEPAGRYLKLVWEAFRRNRRLLL
jgi:hypothetical protein